MSRLSALGAGGGAQSLRQSSLRCGTRLVGTAAGAERRASCVVVSNDGFPKIGGGR
ncbi:Uncharacterised protein [Eggerthella lenta]|uniref:Uncharacterized protein n=1 Tax=Eggerthella lenta TaxID=84112 RepID=A0A6N3AZ21_EGGLN